MEKKTAFNWSVTCLWKGKICKRRWVLQRVSAGCTTISANISWIKKTCSSILRHNFSKCRPIFNFFCTLGFYNKYATILWLYFPPHLNHVTTLPCETSAADTFDFQRVTINQ